MRDWHVFMWQSVKVSNVFNTLTLKQIFWKTKTFFKKLEYHFLVETTKIENTSFPLKTARSETNVKTNRMRLQNGPITKSGVFPVNTLFFWKICFSFRTSLIELIWCTKCPYLYFSLALEFNLRVLFHCVYP